MTARVPRSVQGLLQWVMDHSILLLAGTLAGLVWANTSPHAYDAFAHRWHFLVNDLGMVFFFAIAAKEVVEATLPGGPLASPTRAAVPLFAAVGGMLGPALLHVALASSAGEPELTRGWAIPCATDIAFSYLVARLIFGAGHPALPFLLLLAIADDALGLGILALFYPTKEVRLLQFVSIVVTAMMVGWVLNRKGVRSFWPYVIVAGAISWVGFLVGGLHPALALVPIVPFIPHGTKDLGTDPGRVSPEEQQRHDALNAFEHWWRVPVQIILFFFGLVNAGVPLTSVGVGTWVVLTALVVGKPLGIVLFTTAAGVAGLQRPSGVSGRDVLVLGVAAGIGFTVSLFFATAAYPEGRWLAETKMGALLSFSAAGLALLLAALLRVGRFERARVEPEDSPGVDTHLVRSGHLDQ